MDTKNERRCDILRFTQARQRPAGCCKNLQSGGLRVLPSLAAWAWDQIAARSVFCEDETKRMGIKIGQAEDEKDRLRSNLFHFSTTYSTSTGQLIPLFMLGR